VSEPVKAVPSNCFACLLLYRAYPAGSTLFFLLAIFKADNSYFTVTFIITDMLL